MQRLEYSTAQEAFFNYCYWPYKPVTRVENKFRPVNLLFQSFDLADLDQRAVQLVDRIREEIGISRTVWGVKWLGNRLAWEFYFYDYQRREREVSISRLLKTIHPLIRCPVRVNESLPYFMFSIDILPEVLSGGSSLDTLHMYVGNPGSTVSSGIAYEVSSRGATLENFYFFFDAKGQLDEAAAKICCSPHLDSLKIDLDQILLPRLRNCQTICVANKRNNDTVYFSGVNVEQFLFFLKLLSYPAEIIAFVDENRRQLDHLLYDVGFDYTTSADQVRVHKSGYYGVF